MSLDGFPIRISLIPKFYIFHCDLVNLQLDFYFVFRIWFISINIRTYDRLNIYVCMYVYIYVWTFIHKCIKIQHLSSFLIFHVELCIYLRFIHQFIARIFSHICIFFFCYYCKSNKLSELLCCLFFVLHSFSYSFYLLFL